MITLKNVTKKYGLINVVNNISFSINSGEIVGLLGPNGAGKTTIMNMITGYIQPTSGEITINNYNLLQEPYKAKQSIGYMPENIPLYKDLTVKEFLNYIADLKSLKKSEKKLQITEIIHKIGLIEVQNTLIRNLSRGFKQRTSLASSLIGNPKILILDEPTVGLDPKQVVEIRELIKSLRNSHTIILSSHILSEISQMCERVIILNKGNLITIDSTENIQKQESSLENVFLKLISESDDKEDKPLKIERSNKDVGNNKKRN